MKELSQETKALLETLKLNVSAFDYLDSKRMMAPVLKITRRQVEDRIAQAQSLDLNPSVNELAKRP